MFWRNAVAAMAVLGSVALACLAWPAAQASAGGIGLAPSRMEIQQAMRGGEYDRSIWIFNPGDDPSDYTLRGTGGGSASIKFYDGPKSSVPLERVTVPGNGNKEVLVRFTIAEQASNGTYEATLVVGTSFGPPGAAGGPSGQAVAAEAESRVRIEVTGNQMLRAAVDEFVTADTEVNYPLRLSAYVRNTGNVTAKPKMVAAVYQGSSLVAQQEYADTEIKPEGKEPLVLEINTKGWRDGDYLAKVAVSLGDSSTRTGEVIGEKELRFKVLPVGTLTRAGELAQLVHEGEPVAGRTVRILATFANTGQIETPAVFIGEVYRDGQMLDTIDSREVLVLARQQSQLLSYLKLDAPGNYVVKGKINFGGKQSNEMELAFKAVTERGASTESTSPAWSGNTWVLLAAIDGLVILGIVIGALMLGRRRRGGEA